MKLIFVIGSMELGGAEQHLLRVASALRVRGHAPEVFTLTTGGPLTKAFADNGVPVHGVRLSNWVCALLRNERAVAWVGLLFSSAALWRLFWRRRADVVHFFLPAAYIVGGVTALFGPRMLRVMSRRSLNHYQTKHRLFARVERWLHPRMDLVCGNSRAVVQQLLGEGVPRHRVRLIYNGVDTSQFAAARDRQSVRGELGIDLDAVVFIVVANLIPYKGHADLLHALAGIAPLLHTPWVCLCVGRDDGVGPALRAQAAELGILANLRFLGSRRDVPDLLAAADIGVLCSHEEGFSNAVIEGMASGLPMVVSDVGGNAEAVLHGENGLVVPPRSPGELGRALLQLALDPEARDAMGTRGLRLAATTFAMDACIDQYVLLYRREMTPLSEG